MPYVPFADLFPDLAREETRSVLKYDEGVVIQAHLFLELFCNEPGCDCRRVFIQVISDEASATEPVATLSWGWEPDAFYREWAGFALSKEDLDELRGPALVRLAPQGPDAEARLADFRMLLEDESYASRIVRHYRMFRDGIESGRTDDPTGPPRNRAERRRLAKLRRRPRRRRTTG
ncbi:MAG: hypothetical protein R3B82_15845 [Sandaracinaceae bacterium]